MDSFLKREDTKIIKGLAIVLMLMHHLWGFPEKICVNLRYIVNIAGMSSIQFLGYFGKICVPIFFLVGGYGTYISSWGKPFNFVGKIKGLYISYWKVFAIFIPVAFIFFGNQPVYAPDSSICNMYYTFSIQEFFKNITAIDTSYNPTWWFLFSYICILCMFPLLRQVVEKLNIKENLALVVIISLFVGSIAPAVGDIEAIGVLNNTRLYKMFINCGQYSGCFLMGMVVAKEGILDRLDKALRHNALINPVMDVVVFLGIVFMRQIALGEELDFVYIPIMIVYLMDLVKRIKPLRFMLLEIGKESTNMWLIHAFLCYYFYESVMIVTILRWAVPSLILLTIMTYVLSVATTYIWNLLLKRRFWSKER